MRTLLTVLFLASFSFAAKGDVCPKNVDEKFICVPSHQDKFERQAFENSVRAVGLPRSSAYQALDVNGEKIPASHYSTYNKPYFLVEKGKDKGIEQPSKPELVQETKPVNEGSAEAGKMEKGKDFSPNCNTDAAPGRTKICPAENKPVENLTQSKKEEVEAKRESLPLWKTFLLRTRVMEGITKPPEVDRTLGCPATIIGANLISIRPECYHAKEKQAALTEVYEYRVLWPKIVAWVTFVLLFCMSFFIVWCLVQLHRTESSHRRHVRYRHRDSYIERHPVRPKNVGPILVKPTAKSEKPGSAWLGRVSTQ